jgi:MFS family permease
MADTREELSPKEDDPRLRWYQNVPRYAWLVLAISALGWLFDTMDQHLFNLVRQPSVTELLKGTVAPGLLDATAKQIGGQLTAVFLIGWAVGGFIFGILGDRLGRARTMVMTICIYALFTGFNGLVHTIWQYELCRFLTALGVGGEFAVGTALVAEVWPQRSRPMALGTLQACSAVGNIMAALITLALSSVSWRWAYAVGAAPALLVVWVISAVKEPERWQQARDAALKDPTRKELGNITELFHDPILRRNTIAGILLALAGVGGVWGVGFFLPDLVGSALKPLVSHWPQVEHLASADQRAAAVKSILQAYRSKVSIVQQVGAFCGMFTYAALSQRTGRKPALLLFFILAFLAVQLTFWKLNDPLSAYLLAFPLGFCALAPFSAYAVYFPELYPTRLRATGIGVCYNCARVLAAFAPMALGSLAKTYASATDETAGLRVAASIVSCIYVVGLFGLVYAPETRGRPLPE